MRDIPQSFLNKLKQNNYKVRLSSSIDWENDGFDHTDVIDNYILSATIDKNTEGGAKLFSTIIDKSTFTLDNSLNDFSPKNLNGKWASGNQSYVIPSRDGVIYAGLDNDTLNVFDGVVTDIKPNYNTRKVSISLGDYMSIFEHTNCPNKFYVGERAENILKEWIDIVNNKYGHLISYSSGTIDDSITSINFNFDGMKMKQGLNMICESLSAEAYIDNKMFYFNTPLSPNHINNTDVVCEFIADPNYTVNPNILQTDAFKIKEEYSTKTIYNEVEIKAEPFELQPRQQIWTGAENEVEVLEEYNSNKIINNELQLTYVPEGETEEVATKNIPVMESSMSILDISNPSQDLEYTVDNGGLTSVSESGLITFANTEDYPTPEPNHALRVKYIYIFNQLLSGKEKTFFVDLDYPAIDIEQLFILPTNVERNPLPFSFTSTTDVVNIEQTVLENKQRVKISITNNTSETAYLFGNLNGEPVDNLYLMGKPFKKTNRMSVLKTEEDSAQTFRFANRLSINNDLISSHTKIKQMVGFLLSKYAFPFSILDIEVKGLPHLEMNDRVRVVQVDRDIDDEFLIKGIKHKFSKNGTWYTTYKLEQADASDWTYTEDGTLILGSKTGSDFENRDIIPPDVTEFDARIINDNVILRWNKIPFADSYEIRVGDSWETATKLTQVTKTNYYNVGALPAKNWTFWIKAISAYEKPSANASSADLEVFEFKNSNIIKDFTDDFSNGIHSNTTRFDLNGSVSLATSNRNIPESTTEYFPCELNGTYLSPVFDAGQITKSRIYPDLTAIVRSEDLTWSNYNTNWLEFTDNDYTKSWLDLIKVGEMQVNLKYSEDNLVWKTVTDFIITDVKARYYQLEIIFNNDTQWGNFAVLPYNLYVDVPDIIDKGTATIDGTGTVNFNKSFYDIKSITATPINTGSTNGINYEITNYSNTSFTIKIEDNSGNPITTEMFWEAVGY